ncbi:MAG: CRISPR-associated endonuclease Cas2 [Deltaproteobacteria bacterium]
MSGRQDSKKYGTRVQKSVFECPNLTEKQFLKLKHRIEDSIAPTFRYSLNILNREWGRTIATE